MQVALPTQLVSSLSAALGVLTAMITPALLISASGMFILSTSNRLGRVIDRVRAISDKMDQLMRDPAGVELLDERKAMLMDQTRQLSSRAHLLQRTLTVFYLAAGLFVLTSVAIGIDALLVEPSLHWLPVGLGLSGACGLLYGSVLLIQEARLALVTLSDEMNFLNRLVEVSWEKIGKRTPTGTDFEKVRTPAEVIRYDG
ncbi:MAG: DUF2721 domain-containing protein [Bryobacteraceae bacterium]|nr:DUF2721 domain-containing protein [Bryobacteraceae bacterium]MDW8377906.1 DUF2721 domain-containing protein [Bryobacterales bacterium]